MKVRIIFIKIFSENSRFFFLGKCIFHSGSPIFHDVYKGWSCCNKKSTDFTEFLNFKGCCQGEHSSDKPVELAKLMVKDEFEIKVTEEERKPMDVMTRPPFESPCTKLEPIVNSAFKQQMDQLDLSKKLERAQISDDKIPIGTNCKNGGCGKNFESSLSNETPCVYHPGVPIFHEGYKFWSCCKRKTSDFSAFLSQLGCENGKHKWFIEGSEDKANCRWDWHQTPSTVVVAIYAKNYDYKNSFVKINPVRLIVKMIFPQQKSSEFNLDLELRGIVKVSQSEARMYATKIEVSLPKAEPGQWVKLSFPREIINETELSKTEKDTTQNSSDNEDNESEIDLDDIEAVHGAKISELASSKQS